MLGSLGSAWRVSLWHFEKVVDFGIWKKLLTLALAFGGEKKVFGVFGGLDFVIWSG